tara:strand:+ start:75 stop:236 length:162 start_codon:yes stop_codon:yes gene_type:complete
MFGLSLIVLVFGFNNNEWFLIACGILGVIASPYFCYLEWNHRKKDMVDRVKHG